MGAHVFPRAARRRGDILRIMFDWCLAEENHIPQTREPADIRDDSPTGGKLMSEDNRRTHAFYDGRWMEIAEEIVL